MRQTSLTGRVNLRPNPALWQDDELMTLAEAAALLWPQGPISERTLRTAVREGRLPISKVAGKFFVTLTALRLLSVCTVAAEVPTPQGRQRDGFEQDLAIIKKLRERQ